MSKDNGIYVLKTQDNQYRVIEAQAIENIYKTPDVINKSWIYENEFNFIKLFWYFNGCKTTYSDVTAYQIARKLENLHETEYGIKTIITPFTWYEILTKVKKSLNDAYTFDEITEDDKLLYNQLYQACENELKEYELDINVNKDKSSIKQILLRWKREAGLGKSCIFYWYLKGNECNVYIAADLTSMYGDEYKRYNKYCEELKSEFSIDKVNIHKLKRKCRIY